MAETIKLPFAFWTRVVPMNHVLHEVQIPTWKGTILRGKQANQYRDTLPSSVQTWLNWSRCCLGCGLAWTQSIMCYMASPDPPWERAILVDTCAHCIVWVLSAISCAKTAEPIHLPFWLWIERAEGCTNSIVFARWRQCALVRGHIAVTCRITLNHPSTAAMRLMANYFDHLLSLDTPNYTVAQITKRFEPSTVLWAFHTIQLSSCHLFLLSFLQLFC